MTSDNTQAWQALCKQAVKSSGALREYHSNADKIADAKATISYLKANIQDSRVTEEIFKNLLQIGDHDLIAAALKHHTVNKFLDLQRGHRCVSFKGATARGDIALLAWLKDLGFDLSQASNIILRTGLQDDCADMVNFAVNEVGLNLLETRNQLPYYIRICGPNCAPILDHIVASNKGDWKDHLNQFFISACAKIEVKTATLLTLYGIGVPASQLPANLLINSNGMFLYNHLSDLTASNHTRLRLLEMTSRRIEILGTPRMAKFANVSRSEILMRKV